MYVPVIGRPLTPVHGVFFWTRPDCVVLLHLRLRLHTNTIRAESARAEIDQISTSVTRRAAGLMLVLGSDHRLI